MERPIKRVLVVEDDRGVREHMTKILGAAGYEVRAAVNGLAGVSMAHDYMPDVIVCDHLMPELNGLGALELLRQHLRTEAIPVIFATAVTDRNTHRRAMEQGADDYLTKPFTSQELLASVGAQLAKREVELRRVAMG